MKRLIACVATMALGAGAAAQTTNPHYDSIERLNTVIAAAPLAHSTTAAIQTISNLGGLQWKMVAGAKTALVTLEARQFPGGVFAYSVASIVVTPPDHP